MDKTQINDGGPIHPVQCTHGRWDGMSLRDWFAGQALVGILSGSDIGFIDGRWTALNSFAMADAMLAAREVKP